MLRRSVLRSLLLLALALGSCSPSRPSEDSLRVLLADDILALDPNQEVEAVTDSVLFNVFEPLVGLDDNLQVRTILAESWEHPTPERWRFRLRKDVRFQDGTPMTAALVRDSLRSVQQASHLEAADFLGQVQQIAAADDYTIDIVTREPRALLGSLPFLYVCKRNSQGDFPPLVGTGPYRIRDWKPGRQVSLERWSGYRGPAPEFREAVFVPVRDPKTRIEMLRSGSADIAYGIPPELVDHRVAGIRFIRHPGLTVYYLGFDMRPRPGNRFRDPRVRKAFHLGLDRGWLTERLLLGRAAVPTQPIAPLVFGYDPGLPVPEHDPRAARRLLAEAGHAKGLKVRLDFVETRSPVARLIGEGLLPLGVDVELNGLAKDAFYEHVKAGRSELFFAGWDCSSGEASEFYEFSLHTPTSRYGRGNYGGYSSAEIDRIAETNSAILDPRGRKKLLQQAAALVMQELPVLPLYVAEEIYAAREGIAFRPRADSEIKLADVRRGP